MKRAVLLSSVLFLSLWALRIKTLHSAFHPDDSPETATAGYLPGIQHPPGYPLPTLLGRVSCLFLPGGPALAQNFGAALASCLALMALLGWMLGPLRLGLGTSLLCSLGAGLATQSWFQGASAKGGLYSLNAALTFGALWAFHARSWRLGFLIMGLGLASHFMSFLLFIPLMLWWARPLRAKNYWPVLPGLSLYLYLPIRSRLNPELDWGNPETFQALWDTVSRSQYAGQGSPLGFDNTLRMLRQFLHLLPDQIPWPLFALGLYGLWIFRREQWPWIASLLLYLAAAVYRNAPLPHAPWVANAFFLPVYLFLWASAGLALGSLAPKARNAASAAALVLIAASVPGKIRDCDYSQDFLFYDYSRDLLEPLPKSSVLLAAGGNDAFGVWYQQYVLGRRRDVLLVDVPLISDWYLAQLGRELPLLSHAWTSRDELVGGLLKADLKRPLFYTSHNPGDRGIPLGLVCFAPPPGASIPLSPEKLALRWKSLRLRHVQDRRTPLDGNRAELLQYYPDSAAALEAFALRFQSQPLAGFARELSRQFTGAKP